MTLTMPTSPLQNGASDRQRTASLRDGAEQFEAMMINEMLKPLHFGASPDSPGDTAGNSDTISGFGSEAVAKALAHSGGFGLAKQMMTQIQAEDERVRNPTEGTKVL